MATERVLEVEIPDEQEKMNEMKQYKAIAEWHGAELQHCTGVSMNSLRKLPDLCHGAAIEFLNGKGVKKWPNGESINIGGANSWEKSLFCIKNGDGNVLISSFNRCDKRIQIQVRRTAKVFGYNWDGEEVKKKIETKIDQKAHLKFPYGIRIDIEDDVDELRCFETMKETRERERREQDMKPPRKAW